MKFRDGDWLLPKGLRAHHPAQVQRVLRIEDGFSVLAPAARLDERAAMHEVAALTIDFSAPMPDVIRVRLTHHAGALRRPPLFDIHRAPAAAGDAAPTFRDDPKAVSLTSGKLTARVSRTRPWLVSFQAGGRDITTSDARGMAAIEWDGKGHFMHEQLSLGVGERIFGLGEQFGPLVKNGQSIDIWNRDGGTGSNQAYKNVPFYLSDRGYGVFVNDPGLVSFEVASERVGRVQFSVEGQSLEYFLIYGPTPKEVLDKYTALTGRPALPPAWSFGLWLSTSFTTDYDEKTVTCMVDGMAERDIPLSVFHFDCFWMRELEWCNFEWDERVFPDPKGMLERFHARGLKVSVWINPYVSGASPAFDEAAAGGFLLRRPEGTIWQTDKWQPGMGVVDLTNPAARAWYRGKLAAILDQGVDVFKTDFGERIPTDVVWFDGSDPERMHNYYARLYNETVFELLREKRGEGEAVVFARSATTGCQQFSVHWGGDSQSNFVSMADSLRGGLSLGMSGFGFWSHDIGGFEGNPAPALYHRWAAFGLLSSHSRLHGSDSYRAPWLIDDKAVDVIAAFTKRKCALMPYLYGAAVEASRHGVPMMRAMMLEFPADPTAGYLDRQYMLGGSLLVAPVFTADGETTYYVPAGRWTHFLTGGVVEGPGWKTERYAVDSLPLFARPGAVIPIGARDDRPDYDFSEGVTLRVYEPADGATVAVEVPDLRGETESKFRVRRSGAVVTAERTAGSEPWRVLLVNSREVAEVGGGTAEAVSDGTLLTPAEGSGRLEATLV